MQKKFNSRACKPQFNWVTPIVLLMPSFTTAAKAASIEDELFGTPDQGDTSQAPPAPESPIPAKPFVTNSIAMREAVQKTTIGGRADWSLVSTAETLESPGSWPLKNSFSGLVYLDSRPSDFVRGYLKLNISESDFRLLELWLKWQTEYGVFWTIGKQPIKWGSATLWNPTDFLAAETRDPLAFFDDREGVQALRAHWPFEAQNANFYLVASLPSTLSASNRSLALQDRALQSATRPRSNNSIDSLQLSARSEWAFQSGEIAAAYAFRQGGPTRFGIDLSAGIGPFDFDSEASCTFRSRKKFFKRNQAVEDSQAAETSPEDTVQPPGTRAAKQQNITPEERKQLCLPQAVVGSSWEYKYTDSDSFTLGIEYFWNGLGHNDPALELVSFLEGGGTPLYLGQKYIGSWFILPKPASWNNATFQFNYIKNLTDFSELFRLSYIHEVLTYGRISLGVNARNGLGEFRVSRIELENAVQGLNSSEPEPGEPRQNTSEEILLNSTPKWQADLTFSVTL